MISNLISLILGLIIFSFFINSAITVPFIDILYKIKLTRRGSVGKKTLFNKLHDHKAGTPVGGGVLIILSVVGLFLVILPLMKQMGVSINSSFSLRHELIVIYFTFLSFGVLGLIDDLVKTFGRPRPGTLGMVLVLSRSEKFILQWILALIDAFLIYKLLGIQIIHIPFIELVLNLGIFYVPFAAFIIVFFANAFNITDGLDGLSSGLLIIYLFAYMTIAAGNLDTPLFVFMALWIGSLAAFLYFNIWPARVWLGDAGALSFGAMIAVIGLIIGNVAALFVIGGIFVLEAVSSAIQIFGWKFLKRPIFPIAPIHHTFLAIGWEEPKIVMRAWIAGIMLAIFGLWLATI